MSKQFKLNNYSEAILEDYENFEVYNLRINKYQNAKQLLFDWKFKSYEDNGKIDYDNNFKLKNVDGDNNSLLSLPTECRNNYKGLKKTASLYNDASYLSYFKEYLMTFFKKANDLNKCFRIS